MNQFSRTALLLGQEGLEKLAAAKVAVFGLGGVGAYAAEALARSGVGALVLVDDDKICLTNINRQLIATLRTVGRPKAAVMRERVLEINAHAQVETHEIFYGPQTASAIDLGRCAYVIDAIDTVSAKLHLIQAAQAAGVPIISCMGAGNKLDPTRLEVADIYETSVCPLAKVMRKELRALGVAGLKVVYSKEPPLAPQAEGCGDCKTQCVCPPGVARKCTDRRQIPGSTAFVPPAAGLILAGEVVRALAGV
jgi:tRNA A37 threonylcarbamoyladenosine dehydratase